MAIDLSGVTFIDGAGLQVLLDLQDRLAGLSGELELLSPTPAVVGLLHEAHIHGTAGLPGTDDPASGLAWDGSPFGGRPAPRGR
ncbi:STAS domain-containing protein [Nakamurella sp.]|uniref:STAS domain-containing protein n=1 Tax=Nakamurella sp. TaxID=1869182 RepID=UPI003B3A27F3